LLFYCNRIDLKKFFKKIIIEKSGWQNFETKIFDFRILPYQNNKVGRKEVIEMKKLKILNDNKLQSMKHVCLIFTPIDIKYKDALTHFVPPLGLVALENYIRKKLPNVKISILDEVPRIR